MSPKIAFALLLLGCGLLGLANADRYFLTGTPMEQGLRWSAYKTRRIPVGPGSQGNACYCPCWEMNDHGGLSAGVRAPGFLSSPEIFDSPEDDEIGFNEVSTFEKDFRPR